MAKRAVFEQSKARSGRIRTTLLAWYDRHPRDLPWRKTRDPYRVWVAEIMLQQTRVDTVIPYYERWLATFPDVRTLADATTEQVLGVWEGLGYYSRARSLHRSARLICERHGGELPRDVDALRDLPGIGDYTAGAIASIAFGVPTPAIDGNLRRVLARLNDVARPGSAWLRTSAVQLLDAQRPGDVNQALMDLGRTVCTPRAPACAFCPLRHECRAHARGTTHLRPAADRKARVPHVEVRTLITRAGDRVLLRRRDEAGMLGGLWEFPETEQLPADARPIGAVTHTYSHKRVTYHAYLRERPIEAEADRRWAAIAGLAGYPMSVAQRKIERLLLAAVDPAATDP